MEEFSATRRPNSLIVTTVTRSRIAPRSAKNAASDAARSPTIGRSRPEARVPMLLCMSQEPESTVTRRVPTSARTVCATVDSARPRSEDGYEATLSACAIPSRRSSLAPIAPLTARPIRLVSAAHIRSRTVRRARRTSWGFSPASAPEARLL